MTNNKTAFRVDTEEWELLKKRLEEVLTDLKRESRRRANPGRNQSPKDEAEVAEYIAEVKDSLKSSDLQQDLDRRALDADLSDEFAEGPLPFNLPSDEGSATGEEGMSQPGDDDIPGGSGVAAVAPGSRSEPLPKPA